VSARRREPRQPGQPGRSLARGVGSSLVSGLVSAAAARAAWAALRAAPPGGEELWARKNHRGEPLTLLEGPAYAAAAAAGAALAPGVPGRLRAAGALAALGAGAFGAVDDLREFSFLARAEGIERSSSKGLRGHLGALRRGELTTGGLKILGIGATGLAAAALAVPPRTPTSRREGPSAAGRAAEVATAGALVAGAANLANLFDLRPGRAFKVVLLHAPAALTGHPAGGLVAAACGPAVALLPEDLGERAMLGDTGANAAGALLGTALAARLGPRGRLVALGVVTGLTLASERVSFTKVIAATPGLRELDALGRRPPEPPVLSEPEGTDGAAGPPEAGGR
jgi:UDP-GlcNAc:undecaprenyl-phosphate/decaprenyl-phosphate GlcNAc-1-phosphate transferase